MQSYRKRDLLEIDFETKNIIITIKHVFMRYKNILSCLICCSYHCSFRFFHIKNRVPKNTSQINRDRVTGLSFTVIFRTKTEGGKKSIYKPKFHIFSPTKQFKPSDQISGKIDLRIWPDLWTQAISFPNEINNRNKNVLFFLIFSSNDTSLSKID